MDDQADNSDGDTEESGPSDGDGCQQAVDILLIIDNSGSMGEEQSLLATSLGDPLLAPLELDGVDWRLAITTTDIGNPWCPSGAGTPENGAFQLQSCNEHLEDFQFANGGVDMQDIACNDICPYAPGTLHTLPTTTALDSEPKSRPWIERIGGESNLTENVDPVSAAQCLVPQGTNGCGFEQPLEAMYRALARAMNPDLLEYGFLRDEASLLVVILTDGADCSHTKEEIFLQDGNKVFWTDPQASFPTRAICWNAGVECLGDPSGYDECVAQDFDVDGARTDEDDAVLHPISRYIDILVELEAQKRANDPGADVGVLVIGGIRGDGQLRYADGGTSDAQFQERFGIGPGCTAPNPFDPDEPVQAMPPVRMREVGEALSSDPLASICNPSYEGSFAATFEHLFGAC